MEQALLAFDIETWKIMPEGEKDWKAHRPLGISCASIVGSNGIYKLFCHKEENGDPSKDPMTPMDLYAMLLYMKEKSENGYLITTWNGASFDFDILAEESTQKELCVNLCNSHWDMMYQFLTIQGYPVGLDTVAKTMGFQGKIEGMHGDLAPIMWQESLESRKKVLDYVLQDSISTLQVAEAILERKRISWTSKKGFAKSLMIPAFWTVEDCRHMPEVDQSWMDNPMNKHEMIEWQK